MVLSPLLLASADLQRGFEWKRADKDVLIHLPRFQYQQDPATKAYEIE